MISTIFSTFWTSNHLTITTESFFCINTNICLPRIFGSFYKQRYAVDLYKLHVYQVTVPKHQFKSLLMLLFQFMLNQIDNVHLYLSFCFSMCYFHFLDCLVLSNDIRSEDLRYLFVKSIILPARLESGNNFLLIFWCLFSLKRWIKYHI